MKLREIAPDVYACLQEDRGLGCSNSGLVNRAGGLVVDTFWDLPLTRELISNYARVWKRPAQRVVNTHHNGDHCWGNQLFSGSEIIGHRLCAASFGKERPEAMQAIKRMASSSDPAMAGFANALAAFDFSGIELTPPTTLIEDRLNLDLDGIRVDLLYVGPAHTAGDVIAHLPEHGIVFTGDVLFRLCTPIGWEGTFANWIAALDRIVALEPDLIVPGHGPLCGVEGPREMRDYLVYVRDEASRLFAAEVPMLEAAKRIDLGPYARWTEPERLVFNVARAYRECRGEAYDAPIDMGALFHGMYELRQHLALQH
jgi:glyoxylase-like metal-dependent hydrolase (beta-lactamase superfamily II)